MATVLAPPVLATVLAPYVLATASLLGASSSSNPPKSAMAMLLGAGSDNKDNNSLIRVYQLSLRRFIVPGSPKGCTLGQIDPS